MAKYPIEKFETLPTPFYYYDTRLLDATLATIASETSRHEGYHVHYAVKANPNPKILRVVAAAGLGADCVSGGEIRAALSAGFPADSIVFAGVAKRDEEILLGLEAGIFSFNVESREELDIIQGLAASCGKTARVALRINPNVGAHTHANITTGLAENKFGIAMENMEEVIAMTASMKNIEFIGLHFHIGSQILAMDDFEALCRRVNELQDRLEAQGIVVKNINVGGGLGIDYDNPDQNPIPDFASWLDTYARHLKLRPGQQLHFEPGRAVVGQMGTLIARTMFIKHGTAKQFLILDAGMTELIRPALYGSLHKIENISQHEAPLRRYDVVGPICESSDVFAKDYEMAESHRGDLIAIRSAGAYGEIMASGYNCRPLPKAYTSEELGVVD